MKKKVHINGTVYGLICPIMERIVYVGQTVSPLSKRLCNHKNSKVRKYTNIPIRLWVRALHYVHKINDVRIFLLEEDIPISDLNAREADWIRRYSETKTMLNINKNKNYSISSVNKLLRTVYNTEKIPKGGLFIEPQNTNP